MSELSIPLLGVLAKELKTAQHRDLYTWVYCCPVHNSILRELAYAHPWMRGEVGKCAYSTECCPGIEKNKMPSAGKYMELEIAILTKIIQTRTNVEHFLSYMELERNV